MSLCRTFFHSSIVASGLLCTAALAGCAITIAPDVSSDATVNTLGSIQGSNYGGHAPIVGAKVFVLEATTNGYNAIAKSLLKASYQTTSYPTAPDNTTGSVTNGLYYVTTDAAGSFNITGDYTCDTGQPVYLYAAGGVASSTVGNPAIVNMAMLGLCPSSGNFTNALSYVYMNEVSTVAMAYAMAGFSSDSLHIGSSTTNRVGLQNAALNAATLYDIQGSVLGTTTTDGPDYHIANATTGSNGVVPQAEIDTLGNIVASCVDSANTSVGTTPAALQAESSACSGLFLATTSNGVTGSITTGGSTVPIDTATAMINLAHYPAGVNTYPANVAVDSTNPSKLFNLPTGIVPFTPKLSATPTDWTIAVTYKNIPTPGAIAIDASGNAYVGTFSSTAGYITELSPQGAVTATSTVSVPNLYGMAISPTASGAYTVWTTSNSNSKLYKFSSSLATSSSFTSTYTASPTTLQIDGSGNVYVGNNTANYQYFYLSEFNSAGTLIYHPYNYQFSVANGLALAANGSVWLSATNNNFDLFPNPSNGNGFPVTSVVGGFTNTNAIAVDYLGNAWITGKTTSNQSLVRSTTGSATTNYGTNTNNNTAIGGLNSPAALAVDGSEASNSGYFNLWVANSGNNTVSEVSSSSATSALSPSVGFQAGSSLINTPSAIAADNAGNVWVTNQGNSTVVEIIGSANPVTTPFSAMKPGVMP